MSVIGNMVEAATVNYLETAFPKGVTQEAIEALDDDNALGILIVSCMLSEVRELNSNLSGIRKALEKSSEEVHRV